MEADKRSAAGKGAARKLRAQGLIPAVLYAKGHSTPLTLVKKDVVKILRSEAAEHSLINLNVTFDGSKKEHTTIIKDYQLDPVRSALLHVDFMEVEMDKAIEVSIPIHITHEPVGIKKGGLMELKTREILIECLPSQIPAAIEIDASSIDIGDAFTVENLEPAEGIKVLTAPDVAILTVTAKHVKEEEGEAEEEAVSESEAEEKAQE